MHFKKCQPLLIAGLLAAAISSKAQQPFGTGNLVVYRAGDGTTALSSGGTAVFIDEYTPAGVLVQSIPMPTTSVSGGNNRLVCSGTASSEGLIHVSPNGKYLAIAGYDAAVGTASVVSASTNRVVAVMNAQGVYGSTTMFSNMYSGNNIRSAITTDSTNIWTSGTASAATGGIGYTTAGATTALQLGSGSSNTRAVNIFNGQLYFSTSSGTNYRVAAAGTGLPTTSGQTYTGLTGLPTSTGSPYDFFIATLSGGNQVLYLADDAAGIQKYSLVSGTWVLNGSVGTGGDGYRGITGTINGNTVTLYATSATTATPPVSKLVAIVDTMGYNVAISGSNTSLTTLVTAATNKVFRGVAFAPQCPVPVIGTQPQAQTVCAGTGASFSVTATGTGLTYQWLKNGAIINGATSSSYNITNTALTDTGNYSVVITACSSTTSNTAHLTVNPIPTATITPAGATTFCSGSSVVLNATTGTGYTYQWYNGATQISGQTGSSYTANATGSYTVTVTANTCAATSAATAVTVNTAPTATITPAGATTFCQGGSVVLNANTGTGLTYQWYNGATQISGQTGSSYTATAAGNYTVAISNGTCSATSAATAVTVNTAPTATVTPAGATTFCQGGSVVLNANTGTGLTYQWYNGATQISGQTSSSYTATASGTYKVTVSNGSCSATSSIVTVTVNTLPTATITPAGSTTLCTGGSVVLNANTGTGLTYQWYNGATQISGQTGSSYTATAAGSYTVTVSNGTCSAASAATTVTVFSSTGATITPSGTVSICQGDSTLLSANTGTGLTYTWKQGAATISGATTAAYKAYAAGSYTVTVSNGTCSSTSAATVVNVNALPTATVTPAGATTFCQGDSVSLAANTGTGLSYQWKQGATNISGATAAGYSASASGTYSVKVTDGNNCSNTSTATTVTVNAKPTATITAATDTAFCQGGTVVLNANTGTGLTYQWKQGAGNISGATTASYTAAVAGSYSVIVTNANSCKDSSAAKTIIVHSLPTAIVSVNGFNLSTGTFSTYQWYYNNQPINGATSQSTTATQNGSYYVVVADTNSCSNNSDTVSITNVGVATINPEAGLRIYPNPATDVLHIDASVPVQVIIRDLTGKTVITTETNQVQLGGQPDGLYMISVSDKAGLTLYNGRFLKMTR
ncbi:beta strand repeat-containing protein [Chitinophagaceae bacterium MMS25-I14]